MAFGELRFTDLNLTEHRNMTGGTGAAGQATVADNYSMLEENKPDFLGINRAGQMRIGALNRGQMQVIEGVRNSGLRAVQQVNQAKEDAESYKDAAASAASKSKMGSIISAGASLIGAALLSDEETKENIERIEDALSTLRNLRPVTFNYKEEYSTD